MTVNWHEPVSIKITATIKETEYIAEQATISRTHLGYNDLGIFSMDVSFRYGIDEQSMPQYAHVANTRDWIEAFLDVCDVKAWEDLVGREVYTLHSLPQGTILGIISTKSGRYRFFDPINKQ